MKSLSLALATSDVLALGEVCVLSRDGAVTVRCAGVSRTKYRLPVTVESPALRPANARPLRSLRLPLGVQTQALTPAKGRETDMAPDAVPKDVLVPASIF